MDADNTNFGAGSGASGTGDLNAGGTSGGLGGGTTADLNSGGSLGGSLGGSQGGTGSMGYGAGGAAVGGGVGSGAGSGASMNSGGSDFGGTGGMGGAGGYGDTGTSGGDNESRARGLADMARNAASQAKSRASEQVNSSLDKGRGRAADTLQEVARTLMGQAEGDNPASQYLSRAGEQVQRAADYLQNAEIADLVADTESFARRQPALFLGGAFAIGVLAARFLKSSRPSGESYGAQGRLYDRETALTPYREPADYSASTMTPLGDDEMDWPNGLGGAGGASGTAGGSLGTSGSGDLGSSYR